VATITGRGLATRGFTGYVYIALEDRAGAGLPLVTSAGSPYPQIATAPSQTTSLDTAMQQLNQSVQAATVLLQGVLDERTVASLKESLANLDQVTRTLSAHNARLATILANAEKASGQVGPLLESSQASVVLLRQQLLPQAQSTLRELDALSASMGTVLLTTQQASTRIEPLLQTSNDTMRALQNQVLPQAQRALVRLDHLSTSLDDTATRIKRDPSVLLRGGGAATAGPGEGP
jgi:phospholipid/cholesterol/gamma-HCH transport system substrate-binding protein